MRFWNFTPHAVNIVNECTFDTSIRKHVIAKPKTGEKYVDMIVKSLPSDGVLNAKISVGDAPEGSIYGVPIFRKRVVGCDPIPDVVGENDIVIVSALFVSAYRTQFGNDDRLYTISDPVYIKDDDGAIAIVGCRGICQAF